MTTTKGEWATFSTTCNICGSDVTVTNGRVEPHRCRIDLDAQKNTN